VEIALGWLFACTMFVSATLLFLVQPMAGKLLLPKLGGTPAVWNTCMVFFQAALLAGYAYAHVLTRRCTPRRQVSIHLLLLLVPLAVLPIRLAENAAPPAEDNPTPWLLATLAAVVGLPFFVLATTAPLLQKWYSATGRSGARDPYFLYAASNLGSMLALLGFPTLVEPFLPLKAEHWLSQSWVWSAGYGVLVLLIAACALQVWGGAGQRSKTLVTESESEPAAQPPSWSQRLRWVTLAFVPSSLMLGVTTYLTTDIAALPLFWVIPLALYLLSFILVFAYWPDSAHSVVTWVAPLVVLVMIFMQMGEGLPPITVAIGINLVGLFLVALLCHGEMARSRPGVSHLTEFYLLMSLGGVLGGMFNALVAPVVFTSIAEYPIALVFACLLVPPFGTKDAIAGRGRTISDWRLWLDFGIAGLVGWIAYATKAFYMRGLRFYAPIHREWFFYWQNEFARWLQSKFDVGGNFSLNGIFVYGLPILAAYAAFLFLGGRGRMLGLAVAAMLLTSRIPANADMGLVHQERSFFGVLKVFRERTVHGDHTEIAHSLVHGTILHGMQIYNEDRRREPITYFHRTGPIGQIFDALEDDHRKPDIAVTGLGAGTLASYAQKGQKLTFYDIDPAVARIAQDHDYFTYLTDCPADWKIILGDARLRLADAPDNSYGLMFLDAFSSDSVPMHLISREAFELYLRKLAKGGFMVVNITNRYLDLEPVIGNIAKSVGMVALAQLDNGEIPGDEAQQFEQWYVKLASQWVILARTKEDFGPLADDPRWKPVRTDDRVGIWTDDYSNLLRVFLWGN
jgi:hypothetical protein